MKYVLMSGSFTNLEIYDEIIEFIKKNQTGEKIISFVTATFSGFKENDSYINKLIKAFLKKNMSFDKIHIIDERLSWDEMIRNINNSNIIFLLGGDTLMQIEYINKYKLKEKIKSKEKIIIGMSAGAINMADVVVLAKDEDDNIPKLSIYDGLGITSINIEPHCNFKNKKHWQELIEASYKTDLIVMNDDCYIIGDNLKVDYYGSYLILHKGNIKYKGKKCNLDYFLEDIKYD